MFITTSTRPPAAIASINAGTKRTRCGAPASSATSVPHSTSAHVKERPAPKRSVTVPPIAATAVAAMIPAARSAPSPASVRWNVRSMSTVATAQPPAKKPNTTNATATGRNVVVDPTAVEVGKLVGGKAAGTEQSRTTASVDPRLRVRPAPRGC